jgi:hypothetical protein
MSGWREGAEALLLRLAFAIANFLWPANEMVEEE